MSPWINSRWVLLLYMGVYTTSLCGWTYQILPDTSRLQDLLDIPPPTTKAELKSFLGFTNTFKTWSPALSINSPTLRELGKKDTVFEWPSEAQTEFEQIKKDLQTLIEINPYNPKLPICVFTDASYQVGFGYICDQNFHQGGFNITRISGPYGPFILAPAQGCFGGRSAHQLGL